MKNLELEAQQRTELGKQNKGLRKAGLIPAIIYGHGIESLPVSVTEKAFLSTIGTSAGLNAIINLKVGSKTYPVITHELQKDALTDKIEHVDFLNIRMDQAIKAKVHVELKGTPIGVKDDGGILVLVLREVEIKCLPTNIPEKLFVDVSSLKIGEGLLIADLKKDYKDIEFLTPENEQIAQVSAPTKEEEVAPAAAAEVLPGAVPVEGATPADATKAAPGAKASPADAAKAAAGAKAAPAAKPAAKK